ncbi:S-adenosyl-L-methionine-dependent methyltransferase [Diaporthe sp. PMI_573]|nr:S-adenosyl-L-methionine-dependent methyltransferase [Diaporthaceae sp. PMI_573]
MSRLTHLARRLHENAEKLDDSTAHHVSSLSTEQHTPAEFLALKRELLDLSQEIQMLVQEPSDFLNNHQVQYQGFACLRWLLRFDVFKHVPLDCTSISYASLATRISVPVGRLQSVARMAMTTGLFQEPQMGHITHSSLSLAFAQDEALRDWAHFITEYGQPTAAAFADATQRWGGTEAKNETAYNVAFDTPLPFFEDIKQRDGVANKFARYMQSQARSDGLRHEHLVRGLDWLGRFGETAHIVDVGGSSGFVAAELASAYPGFTFTVQDLPEVISSGPSTLASLPGDISRRVAFVAHDFFQPQPRPQPEDSAAGANHEGACQPDVYLLRKILHDWPADRARHILSNLASALRNFGKPDACIVVMDTILPPPGNTFSTLQAQLRVRDLVMAQSFNSGERELVVWEQLFASTEPRLRLVDWCQPPGSVMAIMTARLDE